MAEKKTALWKRVVGYIAFGIFSLIAAFFLSFPYDALKDRLRLEAENQGYFLRIGSMGPGLFAVRAKDVQLSKKTDTVGDKPPESVKVDSVSVGPSLFPPGVSVSASVMGGSLSVKVGGLSTQHIKVDVDDLDLSRGNLKGFTGIDFAGTIDAHVDLLIPKASSGTGPAEPDLSQASGTIAIDTKAVAINGGTMNIAIQQYGPEPTPIDLPKIVFGDITGRFKFEKGAGTVEEFKVKSTDLEANATGTLKLQKRLEYSEPNFEVRFKPDPEFQKRLGMIGGALAFVGSDPKDPSWRLGRLTGYLNRPAFR